MIRFALLVHLVACGPLGAPPPNTDLAGLPSLSIQVESIRELDSNDDDLRASKIIVHLQYDIDAFYAAHEECATIGDVDTTFNGKDVGLTRPGEPVDLSERCTPPFFSAEMDVGIADAGRVIVSDASQTITAEYPAGTFSRVATLTSHAEWRFAAGETVTVTWSHPELDDVVGVSFHDDDAAAGFDIDAVTHTGTDITFTIPSPAPLTGDGLFDFGVGEYGARFASGTATSCTGAQRCTYYVDRGYQRRVHID